MAGPPVVIVEKGGFPVNPVDAFAPVLTVSGSGSGAPITITPLGAPFIVQGLWSPASLLKDGQSGFWSGLLDPTTLRLFQDAAGTIPAYEAGQPIGKVMRAAGTVDATQATTLSRPTLARWPKGGRRNLLTWTEEFENSVWRAAGGASVSGNILTGTSTTSYIEQTVSFAAPLPVSAYVESATATAFSMSGTGLNASLRFNLVTGAVVAGSSDWTDHSIVPHGSGYIVSATTPSGSSEIRLRPGAADVLVHWAQLGSLPYQRVTTAFDVTEAGVPDIWHLWNDGGASLLAVLPAGSYEIAWVTPLGAVSYASVTSDGTNGTDILRSERMADVLIREGTFTASEKTALEAYWSQRYAED